MSLNVYKDKIVNGTVRANVFIKNGGINDDILTGNGGELSYIEDVRGHNPNVLQISSTASSNIIDNLPTQIFQLGEIPDTIVVLPCGGGTLDFSDIINGLIDHNIDITKNRLHIYLLYITGNVTLAGAMVSPFVDYSGSPTAQPLLAKNNSYKLECYFVDSVNRKNYPYPICFCDVTPFNRVDGRNLVDAHEAFDYALGVKDMPQ